MPSTLLSRCPTSDDMMVPPFWGCQFREITEKAPLRQAEARGDVWRPAVRAKHWTNEGASPIVSRETLTPPPIVSRETLRLPGRDPWH